MRRGKDTNPKGLQQKQIHYVVVAHNKNLDLITNCLIIDVKIDEILVSFFYLSQSLYILFT